uniref:Bromo domain-containing protein n=1 Tax=Panagrolaimus davidi TaxID=227884 RepID=A0A914R1E9_9BILA
MMAKLNRNEYKNKQEFVDDICLIRHNAIEYNPETDMKSRLIRNNAFALLDITEALFEEELDDDFVEKLEEMKKMIDEAKNAKEKSASQVIQLQRRTRLSVLNGFKEDEPAEKEERNVENAKEEPTNGSENVSSPKVVQEEENEESKNADPNNDASNDVPSVKSDTLPEVNSNTETPMDFISQEQTEVSEKPIDPVFIIDKNEIEKVVITAIDRTNNWSIPQLESLGAALTQRIERYTSLYDRTTLPLELIQLVNEFVP